MHMGTELRTQAQNNCVKNSIQQNEIIHDTFFHFACPIL
jgi:hypothetical protein